jgi:hypothetical protein
VLYEDPDLVEGSSLAAGGRTGRLDRVLGGEFDVIL